MFGIDTEGKYPKLAMFTLIGEKNVELLKGFKQGDRIRVSFNPESREYNSKYYTENFGWKIEAVNETPVNSPPARTSEDRAEYSRAQPVPFPADAEDFSDLPF